MQQFTTPKGMVHGSVLVHPETGNPSKIEADSLSTLDVTHYLNHLGLLFKASNTIVVPAASDQDLILVNPTAFDVHIIDLNFFSSTLDADISIYKGVTTATDGTNIPFINRNFASVNTCDAVLTKDPTGVNLGAATLVEVAMINASKHSSGVVSTEVEEIILQQNEKVLIRYHNNATPATDKINFKMLALNVGRL